jgi:hypothetical protein
MNTADGSSRCPEDHKDREGKVYQEEPSGLGELRDLREDVSEVG